MKPLVSVVLPVRNGGKFLAEAVTSILTQTFTILELVLIDDHSTDAAISTLDKSDPRLKIHKSNGQGVINAFDTGFGLCRGRFIARMDADDISLPERLLCQLDYLDRHPGVDIAGSCVEIFSDSGIQGGLKRYQSWLNSVRQPKQVHRQIFIESPLPNPGVMFRLAAIQQLRGYLDNGWPEDYDLFLRADAANMSMGKPDPILLRWREHESRLTHTDSVYRREKFMQAKTHYLVRHRLEGQDVIIWGSWPTGRLMHELIISEGSGLSRENQSTPGQMLEILVRFEPFHEQLKCEDNREYYKTGTLSDVRTRAGFLKGSDDRLYPFVIMVNKRKYFISFGVYFRT